MSKNKPKETIEYVIRLQDKERQLLESLTTAYMLGNTGKVLQGLGIPELVKLLEDPLRVIQVAYSIATIIELFGIETGWPTAPDAKEWYDEKQAKLERMNYQRKEAGGPIDPISQIIDTLRILLGDPNLFPGHSWE